MSGQENELLDFGVNTNPLGPPAWLRPVLSRNVERLFAYPDPDCRELREACALAWNVTAENVWPGNGASELIHTLPLVLEAGRVLVIEPAYVDHVDAARTANIQVLALPSASDFTVNYEALDLALRPDDLVFLGHPANPSGTLLDTDRVRSLASAHPRTWFVIDEAGIDFAPSEATLTPNAGNNLIVLRSFTKLCAVPGLRLGCMNAAPDIVAGVRSRQSDRSVNALARAVGVRALADADFARRTREAVAAYRDDLNERLGAIPGLRIYPGAANFLLVRLEDAQFNAIELNRRLIDEHAVAVRTFPDSDEFGSQYFRVALRTPEENGRLALALRVVLGQPAAPPSEKREVFASDLPATSRRKRRAKPLMLQGTASNAGKTFLSAAFCRILLEDGVKVAPFKAQNISNNSFVTARGDEVARAQVVQAGACRLDPDVRMSPVLIKPGGKTGTQVIVSGKPMAHRAPHEYATYRTTAWEAVRSSYDSLADEFDVLVLEGAGSPGEVNLKHNDIVNMRMARYADAPVLLTGGIDRGGVFASLIGTMEVLEEWERELVVGFLVNRFHGDAALLDLALDYTAEFTGRPVLGVIPYLNDHGLPEEDAVSFKDEASFYAGGGSAAKSSDCVEIALIDLPFISNFTDFEPLAREPDVRLRVVRGGDALGRPDAVILPGTKNTLHDLDYLNDRGLAQAVRDLALADAAEVVGVCGGMQMLGRAIHDPDRIETHSESRTGLGLLELETTLAPEKTLRQVTARHALSGLDVVGYEIHHGRTVAPAERTLLETAGQVSGVQNESGRVWGTYLHGVFDGDEFRRWFIDRLRIRRGLPALGTVQAPYDLEPAFARLAAHVREHVDMKKIYRMIGI